MKVLINKLTRGKKIYLIIYLITLLLYVVTFSLFIKNVINLKGIESFLRYSLLIFFFIYFIVYFISNLFIIIQKYTKTYIFITFLTYIFIIIFIISSVLISGIYKKIVHFKDDNKVLYTSYLINLSESEFNLESKIGIIEDEDEIEGHILAKKLYEKEELTNELVYYEDYLEMLYDLYEQKIDAIFIQNNYIEHYQEDEAFLDIKTKTNILFKYSEKMAVKNGMTSTKDFKDPMTFLIIGVDSEKDGLNENAGFNGDVLMLLTFNPNTLNTTMLSLPRDVFVPIVCRGDKIARINSSAGSGTKCTIDTIANLTDLKIDYYVKINFKGVVDLVESLGGIEVDVEKPRYDRFSGKVCEYNSDRDSSKGYICMDVGLQTLNGEQALAYSRNRKQYTDDLDRNRHQQQVIAAIANKVADLRSFSDFESVLNTISKNIAINMEPKDILSGYDVIKRIVKSKDEKASIDVEKLQLETYNLSVKVTESGTALSVLGYYEDSLADIIKAMKVNLELEKPTLIRTFSFSIDEEYELNIPGKGKKKQQTSKTLPDFVGKTRLDAETFCNQEKLSCTFELVTKESSYFNSYYSKNKIGKQSVFAKKLLSTIDKITFYINDEVNIPVSIPEVPATPETEENTNDND